MAGAALIYRNHIHNGIPERPSVESSRPESYQNAKANLDAYGDSITYGKKFNFEFDDDGLPRKSDMSFQGWPELLGHTLSLRTGIATAVWNMGYPGDRANKALEKRLPGLLKLQYGSDRALLLMGTNDSNDFDPTPSGKGCNGEACRKTYKGQVLSVIQMLEEAGRKTIYLGLLTPAWGSSLETPYADPLDSLIATRNNRIREYNQIIRTELAELPGVKLGPNLFSCFLSESVNRFSLFEDTLHPNALGYTLMAALWYEALTDRPAGRYENLSADTCAPPIYILESLDSYVHGHKQNLLDVGDRYYIDESFTLTNIPAELANGIWVMPANSENQNRDADYLSFDVGSSPVTVYIAYDPAGAPPVSSTHEFLPVNLSGRLSVSDESVGDFAIVRTTGAVGLVRLGGTRSANWSADQKAYLVIVVP